MSHAVAFVECLGGAEEFFEVDMVAGDWVGKVDAVVFAVLLELFAIVVAPGAKDSLIELR